jgi:hypothetical protein
MNMHIWIYGRICTQLRDHASYIHTYTHTYIYTHIQGGDVAWDDVALATEAAVQAIAASCFLKDVGLFSEGRRTVERVATAVGRCACVCVSVCLCM